MTGVEPVVAEMVRDGFVESRHRGRVVGLDADGDLALSIGPVDEPVLQRSCAKPLQAVGMVRAGLDVGDEELAVVSASHAGTAVHLEVVRRLLSSVGLSEDDLDNTPALALDRRAAAEQVLHGGADRLHQNCSGKHAGMLATCVANGWPTGGYLEPDHPLQLRLVASMGELAGETPSHLATDGCGAPIVATSLTGLARAFARIVGAPEHTPEGRVARAMRAHPELVGGDGRDVSTVLRAVLGSVAKDGAEGCFAVSVAGGPSVAVKIGDGAGRAAAPVALAALSALGVDVSGAGDLLAPPVLGHGRPVGALRPHLFE